MFQALHLYAKQLLTVGGFKVTEIPRKIYEELVTALQGVISHPVVMISGLIKLAKKTPGRLIIDDTSNPKYGLKHIASTLKLLSTNGFHPGYKILLFLWEINGKRFPIGFALWHKETEKLDDLFLEGVSILRNRYKLKPVSTSFDAFYMTDEIAKRLDDYDWPFVSRFKKNRKLSGTSVKKLIPRGYGTSEGFLSNGTKLKIIRRGSFFLAFNRMSWTTEKAISEYKARWSIEETFRILKSCLRLNGCHQHSIKAQAIYLFVCLILFASVEFTRNNENQDETPYKLFQAVISGYLNLQNILVESFFIPC